MPQLEAFGQRPDGGLLAALHALDLEQEQVLLGLDSGGPSRLLAGAEEPADVVAQLGERPVVELRGNPVVAGYRSRHGHIIARGERRRSLAAPAYRP